MVVTRSARGVERCAVTGCDASWSARKGGDSHAHDTAARKMRGRGRAPLQTGLQPKAVCKANDLHITGYKANDGSTSVCARNIGIA
jgi:hypothetical protein